MNDLLGFVTGEFNYLFIFCLTLLLVNAIAKLVFDNENEDNTRIIVALSSIIVIACFHYFYNDLLLLIWNTFAVFGLYDFVGRYAERFLLFLFTKVGKWFKKMWAKLF